MPTKPLQTILWREMSRVGAKDIIEIASPLLQELVNYSTNAFARCLDTAGAQLEHLAVLALYLHIIEMTDGVEALISQSCAVPAIPLVRSSFEALLSIEYIFENDYDRRSLSWLAHHARSRLEMYEMLDPTSQRGRDFQNRLKIEGHEDIGRRLLPMEGEAQKGIANMKTLLAREQFKPIQEEHDRFRRTHRSRRPYWFELWEGPSNLRELARHLGERSYYDIMYRYWSRVSHAQDFSRFLTKMPDGRSGIRGLRDPNAIREVVTFAPSLILSATRQIMARFRPGEDIRAWYLREVRDSYLFVTTGRGQA